MSQQQELLNIIEAALLAAGRPLDLGEMIALFEGQEDVPSRARLREVIVQLQEDWNERSLELIEVATGFRFQVRAEYAAWMGRLWAERPPRYSRALLETLALMAYRQPVTRAEIEDVRGVAVSASIIKTLLEREWIRVLGHREVPGRPALYGTTNEFLDSFGIRKLDELPPLADIRDLDNLHADLFSGLEQGSSAAGIVPIPAALLPLLDTSTADVESDDEVAADAEPDDMSAAEPDGSVAAAESVASTTRFDSVSDRSEVVGGQGPPEGT